MNHRKKGVLLCAMGSGLALLLLGIAFYITGNPGLVSRKVTFSVPTGFYEDGFDLEMEAGGGAIYYTLDCSQPDEHSIRYTGPIHIQDVSDNENRFSAIEDVSPYLDWDFLQQKGMPIKCPYTVPTRPVDKATVIRAVSIDEKGVRSEETEAVYFIGYGEKRGYEGMNIMTITTNPENLFSPDNGIYVLGQTFKDYAEKGLPIGNTAPLHWKANYNQRGIQWERNATVHLFNENREMVFTENCGIRIQGGASRALLPKSLNLYTRKVNSSAGFDTGTLLGDYKPLTHLNMGNGGNDNLTLIRDYIVNSLAADLNIVTREYVPCVLFLDGEYWGNYWLTPRLRRDYLSQKYHESPDSIVVIKNGAVEDGDDEDLSQYREMWAFIAGNDMRQRENYEQACALVDIQSCIDYYAIELYVANRDWPVNNYAMWRTRYKGTSPNSDCKWRWAVFDVNLAMRSDNYNMDRIQDVINKDALFASLMENEEFSDAFYARLVSMGDVFHPDKTKAFIEEYKAKMADPMAKQYMRFYEGEKDVEEFCKQCDSLQEFFTKRYDYINQKYAGKSQG